MSYADALAELKAGRKYSHWMWYIFPQIKGLGVSSTSEYYGITDIKEAAAYLADPILGAHMRELCEVLLSLPTDDAYAVFGSPDDKKLRSSMTLFALAADDPQMFAAVLEKFYGGKRCTRTLDRIDRMTEVSCQKRQNKRRANVSRFVQDMSEFEEPQKPHEPVKEALVDEKIFSDEIMLFGKEEKE